MKLVPSCITGTTEQVLQWHNLFFLLTQLKDFILNQPDAYEVKIGDQIFRRPGDAPFDVEFQKHHGDEDKVDYTRSSKNDEQQTDEL